MKAAIFMIGWSVSRETHRIEGAKFYPHFSWDQAKEMHETGLIELQSHSFDMHEGLEADRYASLPADQESTGEYAQAFKEDLLYLENEMESNIGNRVFAYSYPYGEYELQTVQMVKELGYTVTLTVAEGINEIKRGDPASLYELKRINVGSSLPGSDLVNILRN